MTGLLLTTSTLMLSNSAALSSSFDAFDEVWQADGEFREGPNHEQIVVCMFFKEQRTGREIGPLFEDDLRRLKAAPYNTGPRSLTVSFSLTAELGCYRSLNWAYPNHLLC